MIGGVAPSWIWGGVFLFFDGWGLLENFGKFMILSRSVTHACSWTVAVRRQGLHPGQDPPKRHKNIVRRS